MREASKQPPVLRIRPPGRFMSMDWAEMWRFRELLYFLVWRDIKVKYKQTMLGVSWAVFAPVIQAAIFTVIFSKMAKISTNGVNAMVFNMAGLVIWRYFQSALTSTSNSLVGNAALLTKIYFPRLFIPVSRGLTDLVEMLVALAILLGLMFYKGIGLTSTALLLPFLVLIAMGCALGVGLFFAALNVRYRDVRVLVPFLVQMWMYCSIIIPFSKIREKLGYMGYYIYGLNPMGGVVEGFRWCLLRQEMTRPEPPWLLLWIGAPISLALFLGGLLYFRRVEAQFADIV